MDETASAFPVLRRCGNRLAGKPLDGLGHVLDGHMFVVPGHRAGLHRQRSSVGDSWYGKGGDATLDQSQPPRVLGLSYARGCAAGRVNITSQPRP
jgi:hypothetical protein